MYFRHISQIDRDTILDLQDDLLQVADTSDVTTSTDEKLGRCNFDCLTPYIRVALADRIDDIADWNVVGSKLVGIEIDLILPDKTAHRSHLGHTFDRLQRVPKPPVLERPQLGQIVFSAVIDQRIFEDPSDARRVRPNDRVYTFRQCASY